MYYDPVKSACKSKLGAVPLGDAVTFRLFDEKSETFSLSMIVWKDGEDAREFPLRRTENGFTISLRFFKEGLYFYRFQAGERAFRADFFRRGSFEGFEDWSLLIYKPDKENLNWLTGGLVYQIFPDRFYREGDFSLPENKVKRAWKETPNFRPENGKVLNNDFFGGNLDGIRKKLGYLSSLGVTAIYLNPIFKAYSNHRYDTGDYFEIDPVLGTMGDLEALIKEARSFGISLILDGVFNHTGDDSVYFNRYGNYPSVGAYQSKDSPYFPWYRFSSYPNEYESWWGIPTLPSIEESASSFQEFLFGENGVIKFYLKKGVKGFRLDVADELPDFFLKKLRKTVKECDREALILGEVWEDASEKISYGVRREYFWGEELDSVTNYPLKDGIIDFMLVGKTDYLRSVLFRLLDHYPQSALNLMWNILDTHDTRRILTVLGNKPCANKEEMAKTKLSDEEKARAKKLLKKAALLQYTLPGVPCIFYGDENGQEGYDDPFCRACFDWDALDLDLISFYRTLGALRKRFRSIFQTGSYREVFADSGCLVYERKEKESIYVFVNRSETSYSIDLKGKTLEEWLSKKRYQGSFDIAPHSCGVLVPYYV